MIFRGEVQNLIRALSSSYFFARVSLALRVRQGTQRAGSSFFLSSPTKKEENMIHNRWVTSEEKDYHLPGKNGCWLFLLLSGRHYQKNTCLFLTMLMPDWQNMYCDAMIQVLPISTQIVTLHANTIRAEFEFHCVLRFICLVILEIYTALFYKNSRLKYTVRQSYNTGIP